MKELFKLAECLNQKYNPNRTNNLIVAELLVKDYPNVPLDIMQWFIVRHSSQGNEIVKGFEDFDIKKARCYKMKITNEQLRDKNFIDFASFAHYDDPYIISDSYFNEMYLYYKEIYFKNGSWDFPIVAIRKRNKLLVVDGTNRYRHMLICLKNSFDFLKQSHYVYVFE